MEDMSSDIQPITKYAAHRDDSESHLNTHNLCEYSVTEYSAIPSTTVEKRSNPQRLKPGGDLRFNPTDWDGPVITQKRNGLRRYPAGWGNTIECSSGAIGPVYDWHTIDAVENVNGTCDDPAWQAELLGECSAVGFDWWTFCAELPEAAKMFLQIGGIIKESYKKFKKGKNPLSGANLKDIPAAYFMYNFGMKPLVNDLDTLISKIGEERTASVPVKSYSKQSNSGRSSVYAGTEWTYEKSVRAQCMLSFDMDYSPYLNTGSILGAAWELTYASWIVDYFVPIGDYIALRSIPRGMNIQAVQASTKSDFRAMQGMDDVDKWGDIIALPAHYRRTALNRRVYGNSLPDPGIPTWSPNLTTKRLTNLGMFLAQKVL